MNTYKKRSALLAALLLLTATFSALFKTDARTFQEQRPATALGVRFINTQSTVTFEKELNENAGQGWRLYRLPIGSGSDSIGALLARTEEGEKYEYKVLATRRVSTIEKEFAQASAEGWEFRGLTSLERFGDVMMKVLTSVSGETMLVLERRVGETKRRFDYKLLSAQREKTLQNELNQAAAAGYQPISLTRGQDTNATSVLLGPSTAYTVILSRSLESPETDKGKYEYRFLATSRIGTMEKEMNKVAREGFRHYMSAPKAVTLMRRERLNAEKGRYDYKLLATIKKGTMEKEMDEQTKLGYAYLATTNGFGGLTAIFERDAKEEAQNRQLTHLVLSADTDTTTQNRIGEALVSGWTLRDLTHVGQFLMVFDRAVQP